MSGPLSEEEFWTALRSALRSLYDPAALRRNPLNLLLPTRGEALGLQELLLDAVQALRPPVAGSAQSEARRTHQILLHRYVEQFSQGEVAASLGLSARQLRRQEQLAIRALGEYLRTRHGLPISPSPPAGAGGEGAEGEAENAAESAAENAGEDIEAGDGTAYQDDLAWLNQAAPAELLDVNEIIAGALATLEPFFKELNLAVTRRRPPDLPPVAVNAVALRQALVLTLTALARRAAGKRLSILPAADERELWIAIQPACVDEADEADALESDENLLMAQRLLALSGGALVVHRQGEDKGDLLAPGSVRLVLPLAPPATILIVDDNQDALQLVQRYLAGTHYRPVVTRSPFEGLALAQELEPQAILLDVMLPGMDGWETLARLRRHPATERIPVIVCTILPEEQLALALGASAFLRKPLARDELLQALQGVGTGSPAAR